MRDSLGEAADWRKRDFPPSLRPWQKIHEVAQGLARRANNFTGKRGSVPKDYEREVSLQRGGEKMVWRSKRDALERVMKRCSGRTSTTA